MSSFLLYGANGYTGSLIARMAVGRGLRPILAGRDGAAVAMLAKELRLEYRIFRMEDKGALTAALTLAPVVLHCAGPFIYTAQPMVEGCLRTGAHYLDITGEVPVFEAMAAQHREALNAGVMLLPGAGFDVAPTDCLAAHLKRRLTTANRLLLGYKGSGGISRGTATTVLEMIRRGHIGMVRRNGRVTPVPFAWKTQEVNFGRGQHPCITIPGGEIVTAFYSTGIPNIEVYWAVPELMRWFLGTRNVIGWLLGTQRVQEYLRRRIKTGEVGPSAEQRANGLSQIWGLAEDSAGARSESRMTTPDSYTLTALTTLAIIEKVLAGNAPPGFQTPATAYGPDWVVELDGVARVDL